MKICAISDSLTGDRPDNWLALVAARRPGLTAVAEAHGGWTTKSCFRPRFDGLAFARVPRDADLFILLIGSNDLFEAEGGSAAAVAGAVDGVRRLAARALERSPGARILLVAPPSVALPKVTFAIRAPEPRRIARETPRWLGELSAAYRALAAREGWLFADLFPVLTDDDFVDAAHPGAEGNRKIADAVWRVLEPLVAAAGAGGRRAGREAAVR